TGSALRRLLGDEPTPDATADAPAATAHAPSVPEPGTPAGLGDPANPDTAGGAQPPTSED
ncbi:MAG: Proteasome subunit alpha, partial [Klenkia sp.]|nr:Proteasome subunit alpha [Klenkia sp.]